MEKKLEKIDDFTDMMNTNFELKINELEERFNELDQRHTDELNNFAMNSKRKKTKYNADGTLASASEDSSSSVTDSKGSATKKIKIL